MARKNKGMRVPKRVAGMKLSRRTRKKVGVLVGLLGTPEAKGLLGLAVAALAGVLAARHAAHPGTAGLGRS